MIFRRKILNISLLLLAILLGGGAAYVVWLPSFVSKHKVEEKGFGVYENRELYVSGDKNGRQSYIIKDPEGNYLFGIPLKNCIIDYRFREGKLHFKDKSTERKGYIDTLGYMHFESDSLTDMIAGKTFEEPDNKNVSEERSTEIIRTKIPETDPRDMLSNHPFSKEAAKIISGKLSESDSLSRRQILNYCEHFRMSYNTRDIDFLRQVFSEDALIIVGNTIESHKSEGNQGVSQIAKVRLSVRSKQHYLDRLNKIFSLNKKINVLFSDFSIMRHPTIEGIYGVTLRQKYSSDSYSDDGYLFLLWDFRNPSMPKIHVRTWQPSNTIDNDDDTIGIQDFNFE